MPALRDYVVATRPWSFPMSVISVGLGTLQAGRDATIAWTPALAAALGMILCHAAGNVLNDFFDTAAGVDTGESATARYRPHPLVGGLMSSRVLLWLGIVLLALAGALGCWLAATRTPIVAWLALAGLVLTLGYTGGPLHLKYRALGEAVVFLVWGPLMVSGAYAVQRGALSGAALVPAVPFGLLVALVLFANNLRDVDQDARAGIRTAGTLLGPRRGLQAFGAVLCAAYAYAAVAVALGALPGAALLVLLSVPSAVALVNGFRAGLPDDADARTAQVGVLFGALLLAAQAAGLWGPSW